MSTSVRRMLEGVVVWIAAASAVAQTRSTLVVDAGGHGDVRTIKEALDAVSPATDELAVVLIRNGVYNEKLFITKSRIALVGGHRDSTRIVFAELRSNWTKARDNRPDGSNDELDWGAGVVNIGHGATDITIANLTVHNNYGALHGSRDHQFAIRGFDATRIALLSCNVISDGGDALALWNRDSGMYYHADCTFEGWVDYVCPRGWCYITDSRFFGHNLSASIWHDGSRDKSQKLVIRNSGFDGVPGFPLGRHHRDAQIFLLDCVFSATMPDRPIYAPKSPNTVPWIWGERHYYYNCTRAGGDYAWFRDNLHEAEHSPSQGDVTAGWTFDGKWDPESTLPAVLPRAAIPYPRNTAYEVNPRNVILRWIGGRDAVAYRVYLGESSSPGLVSTRRETSYPAGQLDPATRYFWKIDVITGQDTLSGDLWTFTTGSHR